MKCNIFPWMLTCLLAIAPAFGSPGPLPSYVDSTPQGPHHILVIGDSITYSDCRPESSGLCGWRRFLAEACGKGRNEYSFDTLAQVGRTARKYSQELPKLVFNGQSIDFITRKKYTAVIIMLGVNDIGNGKSNVIPGLRQSYSSLIATLKSTLRAPAPPVFFLSILPSCRYLNDFRPETSRQIQSANNLLREMPEIRFIDLYPAFVEDQRISGQSVQCLARRFDSGDHLHPLRDATTQALMADLIATDLSQSEILNCHRPNP